jgi:hypothetical protein
VGRERVETGRRQLQRERHAVEPATDLRDWFRDLGAEHERRVHGAGAVDEQAHGGRALDVRSGDRVARIGRCEWGDGPGHFARDADRLATGRQDLDCRALT